MSWTGFGRPPHVRRKVFVSYHHRLDQAYYDQFSRIFHDELEALTDNSLERKVDSADVSYIMRAIRERHLTGSSCTVVLCGRETPQRKYVDWEIDASLSQEMGLVAVLLPTIGRDSSNRVLLPSRLRDNINSGYAEYVWWHEISKNSAGLIQAIEKANAKPGRLISNARERKSQNG